MSELYENIIENEKVILCGIRTNETEELFNEYLLECENLCLANNFEVVGHFCQNLPIVDKKTAFGKGKLKELELLSENLGIKTFVFLNDLSFTTLRTLEEMYPDWSIIDHTTLILSIFSARATTREAKIQTEMARLKYHLPKDLRHKDSSEDRNRSGGGLQSRGAGESRTSITKRKIEKELHALRKELEKLKAQKEIQGKQRSKNNIKKVALVGYTNAGKSSLLNLFLEKEKKETQQVLAKDQLFATLDTSVRKIKYDKHEFLLFDTVGFVSRLPHSLIEAFHSTLEAVFGADLLLHIIDSNNSSAELQAEVTLNTLKEIKADTIPRINVLNKIDLNPKNKDKLYLWGKDTLAISAKTGEGFTDLNELIIQKLYPQQSAYHCFIPYGEYGKITPVLNQFQYHDVINQDTGVSLKILMPADKYHLIKDYIVDERE